MTGVHEAAGRVIAGRYRLLRRLGTGGRGRVWQAYDQRLACDVALKEIVLPPDLPEQEVSARITRARGEAQHAARLRNHPHVVTVYDVVEADGLPWIVMEFVPGAKDLDAVVREQGPLPPADVARIGLAVLDALQEGHRLGILHRDVKPANVLLTCPGPQLSHPTEGCQVLLIDYGISLEPSSGERLTATADFLGTPGFMAPERAHGEVLTPACDLFSLGGTLYFALEGTGPFDRDSAVTTLSAVLSEFPTPPRRATELTPVLLGLLAKDPAQRMDGDEAARLRTPIAAQPVPSPSRPLVMPPAEQEEPTGQKPPRSPEPSPPTELLPSAEPEESTGPPREPLPSAEPEELTGPPPGLPPHKGDVVRPRRRLPWPRSRRARLIAGVVAVALVAGGVGVYLALPGSSGPEVFPIQVGDSPQGVAVSQGGDRVYVANVGSKSVSVIDTATRKVVRDIRLDVAPYEVAVSPDGRWVYTTNVFENSVSVIDTATRKVDHIPVDKIPVGVALSRDGHRAYVTSNGSNSVSVINTATRKVDRTILVDKGPAGVAVSRDGPRACVTNADSNSVSVINTATRTVERSIPVEKDPLGVAVSRDGHQAYVTNNGPDSVSVIDTATGTVDDIRVEKNPQGVALSRDENRAYVTNNGSNSVSVIDTTTRKVDRPIPVEKGPVGVAVSRDGQRAYVTNRGSDSVSMITF
ncbi:serine/threonine-protein kinase [Streptomyces sp. PSKA30]|uniref:serine/threonine-protein kinase n=1 Tax=Streptomyces sp. PSKA30 TaxID=2874597 RepID=UPI001CD17D2B|nr:serine/threonine-protein kinase [Streptomyces sp. PSKA30]MBZ9640324.1 serine/threonine-protein kinase [Streptomyces sp. PSKA30]